MSAAKPYGERLAVSEPDVTESGLFVVGDRVPLASGIVVQNPAHWEGRLELWWADTYAAQIPLGALLWFYKGDHPKIGNLIYVKMDAIVAWEEFDD